MDQNLYKTTPVATSAFPMAGSPSMVPPEASFVQPSGNIDLRSAQPTVRTLPPKVVKTTLPPQYKTVNLPPKIVKTNLQPLYPPGMQPGSVQLPPMTQGSVIPGMPPQGSVMPGMPPQGSVMPGMP